MNIVICLAIILSVVHVLNCYQPLEARKANNNTNIDALTDTDVGIDGRRQNWMRDPVRKRYQDRQLMSNNRGFDSVIFAIKTGDAKSDTHEGIQDGRRERNNKVIDILADIKQTVMDIWKTDIARPSYRSATEKYKIIKPEYITLRNGESKPSLVYEIETASVLKSLSSALNSKRARRYSDNIARTAAYLYRVINAA